MIQNISILGSTGSIGTQTLDVVDKLNLNVTALTAHSNAELLEEQIRKYKPDTAVLFDEEKAKQLRIAVKDTDTKIVPFAITGEYKPFKKSVKIRFFEPISVGENLEDANNRLMEIVSNQLISEGVKQ